MKFCPFNEFALILGLDSENLNVLLRFNSSVLQICYSEHDRIDIYEKNNSFSVRMKLFG